MGLLGDVAGIFTAGRAASAISNANIAAEHGVMDAATAGSGAIGSAVGEGVNRVGAAGANVNQAASDANAGLQGHIDQFSANSQPIVNNGQTANQSLADYAASKPQFSFEPGDLSKDKGYQFQLAQGQDAITNRAAAMGLGASGNTLKDLTSFGQGLAATHYNDAFQQAQSTFQTNQNTTLANLSTLANQGITANGQLQAGTIPLASQQSGNTTGAAGTNASLAEYAGGLQLQGAQSQGQLSLKGAEDAGNFAVGAGTARAAGITGTGAAIGNTLGDLGGMLAGIPGIGGAAKGILGGL